jgi:hypothetical protein
MGFPLAAQPASSGLRVSSSPSGAEVLVDGVSRGSTPLVLTDISKGVHEITLRLQGYYNLPIPVFYDGIYASVRGPLQRIVGMVQVSISPGNATVNIAGRNVAPGVVRLPTGSYTVIADAFGFEGYDGRIDISSQALVHLDLALKPADFSFSKVYDWKKVANPKLPGVFGALEISFDVTGPGAGEISVLDSESQEVLHEALPDFKTWHQSYRVNLRDSSGAPFPDGQYRIILKGTGAGGGAIDSKEIDFAVKS